jgi:sterol 3beta-glucosyltransferase
MPLKNPAEFQTKLITALKETNNRAIILTGISGMTFDDNKNQLQIMIQSLDLPQIYLLRTVQT